MSQEYIEITEKTVDDAITTACQRLSVTSSHLDYIVVQREKTGFLGIGAKPAIIKARVKEAADATQAILEDVLNKAEKKVQHKESKEKQKNGTKEAKVQTSTKDAGSKNASKQTTDHTKSEKSEKKANPNQKNTRKADNGSAASQKVKSNSAEASVEKEKTEISSVDSSVEDAEKKESKKNNRRRRNKKAQSGRSNENESAVSASSSSEKSEKKEAAPAEKISAPRKRSSIPNLTDEKVEEIKKTAEKFLRDVFGAMEMEVEISEEYDKETGILTVDMEGEDMGVLIGKRGQTLDSLQYLVSLIVNKEVDGYIHVKADTENYRERRKKTLENLAGNIAQKVKRTRSAVALEPMNPYERRIIHSALQGDKYVTTYSEGEEPYRRVIVDLKKDENGEILLPEYYNERGNRGRNNRNGRNGRGSGRGKNDRRDGNRQRQDRQSENQDIRDQSSEEGVSMEIVEEIIASQNAVREVETTEKIETPSSADVKEMQADNTEE